MLAVGGLQLRNAGIHFEFFQYPYCFAHYAFCLKLFFVYWWIFLLFISGTESFIKTTSMEQPSNLFELQLDQSSLNYLNESARWARFLGIIGFIFTGLMVIVGLFFGGAMASMMSGMSGGESAPISNVFSFFMSFAYIVGALLTFFPSLYLFLFSSKMRKAFHNNDQLVLTDSLKNLKSFFKFYGICMVIILSVYALAIIAGIVGAVIGSRH